MISDECCTACVLPLQWRSSCWWFHREQDHLSPDCPPGSPVCSSDPSEPLNCPQCPSRSGPDPSHHNLQHHNCETLNIDTQEHVQISCSASALTSSPPKTACKIISCAKRKHSHWGAHWQVGFIFEELKRTVDWKWNKRKTHPYPLLFCFECHRKYVSF